MFQKAIHRVRPFGGISPHFLAIKLRCDSVSGELDRFFTGATIKHFTGQQLAKYPIPLPPLAKQKRIVAKVDELMRLYDELEARLSDSERQAEKLTTATISQLLAPTAAV